MSTDRLLTVGAQLREVHARLRRALELSRDSIERGEPGQDLTRDLALYCVGFCAALDGHHHSEDRVLFDLVLEHRPDLAPAVDKLRQDHSMLGYLIADLQHALDRGLEPAAALRHLDGIGSILESHFRYEERQLLGLLDTVAAGPHQPRDLFGDIA
jgi:hemerythrin-like domain-containing protein